MDVGDSGFPWPHAVLRIPGAAPMTPARITSALRADSYDTNS